MQADSDVGKAQFMLLSEMESPRIRASYERVLHMILHLGDLLSDAHSHRLSSLVTGTYEIAAQIVAEELTVATVKPGELASQIQRLDRQLEGAADMVSTEELMARKGELRERLTERDAAQQRLQSLAQTLHDLAAGLEHLVRPYVLESAGDESASEEDVEVVFDFDALETKFEKLERELSEKETAVTRSSS